MIPSLNNMCTAVSPLTSLLLRSSTRRDVLTSRRSIQSSIRLLARGDHNHQASVASSSSSSSGLTAKRDVNRHTVAASARTTIRKQHSKSSMLPVTSSSGFLTYDLNSTSKVRIYRVYLFLADLFFQFRSYSYLIFLVNIL